MGSVGQSLSSEEDTNTDLGSTPYSTQIPLIPTSHATLPDREVNSKKWRGSKKVTVKTSDTIFDIARREMGDIRYWRDIVLLNGLKAPYIVSNSSSKKEKA